jgi:hypothetical protein
MTHAFSSHLQPHPGLLEGSGVGINYSWLMPLHTAEKTCVWFTTPSDPCICRQVLEALEQGAVDVVPSSALHIPQGSAYFPPTVLTNVHHGTVGCHAPEQIY